MKHFRRTLRFALLAGWLYLTTTYTHSVDQQDANASNGWDVAIVASVLAFNLPIWIFLYRRHRKNSKAESQPEESWGDSPFAKILKVSLSLLLLTVIVAKVVDNYDEIQQELLDANVASNPYIFVETSKTSKSALAGDVVVRGEEDPVLTWSMVGKKSGDPVVWRTCKPIEVYVNPASSPFAIDDVKIVIDYINLVTALNFKFAGTNDERLKSNFQPTNVVQIVYDNRSNFPTEFRNNEAIGLAVANIVDKDLVNGQIAFYLPEIDDTSENTRRKVVFHEFGHIIGLGHTTGKDDLMSPTVNEDGELGLNETVLAFFKDNPGCKGK